MTDIRHLCKWMRLIADAYGAQGTKAACLEAASTIEAQAREIRERDEKWGDYPALSARLHDREKAREAEQKACADAITRAETAGRQLAEAVKVLKPFADLAGMGFLADDGPCTVVKLSKCSAARAFLASLSPEESGS